MAKNNWRTISKETFTSLPLGSNLHLKIYKRFSVWLSFFFFSKYFAHFQFQVPIIWHELERVFFLSHLSHPSFMLYQWEIELYIYMYIFWSMLTWVSLSIAVILPHVTCERNINITSLVGRINFIYFFYLTLHQCN